MIVKCARCDTEFSSTHSHTHICPNCQFVFKESNSEKVEFKVVRSSDLVHQSTGHRLLEEGENKCAFHLDADAVGECKLCGRPICYACAVETFRGYFCEPCADSLIDAHQPEAGDRPPEGLRDGVGAETEQSKPTTVSQAMARQPYVAWEYRRQTGRLNALFVTWKQTLFSPLRFFRNLPLVGDYRSPLLYGLFWTMTGLAAGVIWKLLFYIYPLAVIFFKGTAIQFSLQLSRTYVLATGALLLSPVFALMMVLVACTIYHFFVMLFTRQHAGFEATLRVMCYSTGTNAFYFLPLLGGLLGGLWQLILVTVGFKEVHRISLPLAVVVTLIPYTLLLVFWIALMLWAVAGNGLGLARMLTDLITSALS
ncbi:MAG: YIP1 family protein [Candidatus Hydrogenedentota bacterium]|nr:MAG: YIP1 family protein [Candidatus Hydrogenedentota bacterium]